MKPILGAVLIGVAGAAQAVELTLPTGAHQMITRDTAQDRFLAPVGVFADGDLPNLVVEGPIARSAWRIDVADLTPLQLIAPLRSQLEEAGFRIVLDCEAQACGGHDFRFAAEVLPAPNMYVNIRSYHALTALRGEEGGAIQAVSVMASAASGASFVQIIQAGMDAVETTVQTTAPTPLPSGVPVAGPIPEALAGNGHVVLSQLDFESGTSQLGQGPFSVLEELARALQAQPEMRIALVGHTDNIGGLDGNIALSVSRAQAVRERLITQYAISPDRLEARGMGYLSPHTSNTTEAGREANRRVEAVVLAQ